MLQQMQLSVLEDEDDPRQQASTSTSSKVEDRDDEIDTTKSR